MTAPLTLSLREFCARVPMSRTTFYKLDRAGAFDSLKVPYLKNRFSLARVEEWVNGRQTSPMHLPARGLRAVAS